MAKDFIPAVIKNNTTNAYMVILNGDLNPGKKLTRRVLQLLLPGNPLM